VTNVVFVSFLNKNVTMIQDSQLVTWDVVCSQILGRHLHIWSTFASTVFVNRVQVKLLVYTSLIAVYSN